MSLINLESSICKTNCRLEAVNRYLSEELSDLKNLNDVVEMLAKICDCPIAYISLIDDEKQFIIARKGTSRRTADRVGSFCADTVDQDEFKHINDLTLDNNYKDCPHVKAEPFIKFYAGMPIKSSDGYNVGTICVIDFKPKALNNCQIETIKMLSNHVIYLMELQIALSNVEAQRQIMQNAENLLKEKYTAQNKQLESLAAVMSHQISGPVATMKGLMYLINNMNTEESKEYFPLMDMVIAQMDEAVKEVTANAFAAVEKK